MTYYDVSIGANAPPVKISGNAETVMGLSLEQPSFFDVFTMELGSSTPEGNNMPAVESWQNTYDVNSSGGDQNYNSTFNSNESAYEVTLNQADQSVQQSSSAISQNQETQSSSSTAGAVSSQNSNPVSESEMKSETSTLSNEKTSEQTNEASGTETNAVQGNNSSQEQNSAQEIAMKLEDAKKAVLEAAQASISKMTLEQQTEMLAKVFAMMAPEAMKTASEVVSNYAEQQKPEISHDLDAYVGILKVADLIALLKEKIAERKDKSESATINSTSKEMAQENISVEKSDVIKMLGEQDVQNIFRLLKKTLEANSAESKASTSSNKSIVQELKNSIHETENQKIAQDVDKRLVDLSAKPVNMPQVNSAAQQKTATTEAAVDITKNVAQTKKVTADTSHQPVALVTEKGSQAAGSSELFGLARTAEARETTPVIQIAKNIQIMVKEGKSSMKVELYPESLGKIELRLVSTDNGMSVILIPNQASTGKLLESQLNQLRNALANAGVQLSDVNVSHQNESQQNEKSLTHRGNVGYFLGEQDFDNENSTILQLDSLSAMDYRV